MKVATIFDGTHNPFDEAHWVSCLRENLTSSSYGEGLETGRASTQTPRQSFTRQTQYRDEKTSLDIETFHSHTENGIRQELFAILLVAVIARMLMVLMTDRDHPSGAEPQLKHAIITVATEAAVLTPHCPALALVIFTELLNEIARVRYYPPSTPRPSEPRVSRQPISKWQISKTKRLMNA